MGDRCWVMFGSDERPTFVSRSSYGDCLPSRSLDCALNRWSARACAYQCLSATSLFGMRTVHADSCFNSEQIDTLFISVRGGPWWVGGQFEPEAQNLRVSVRNYCFYSVLLSRAALCFFPVQGFFCRCLVVQVWCHKNNYHSFCTFYSHNLAVARFDW